MAPNRLQQFITTVRHQFDKYTAMGEQHCLLTSPMVRPYVRSIVERFRPQTVVMSQNEFHPQAQISTLGPIGGRPGGLGRSAGRAEAGIRGAARRGGREGGRGGREGE